VTIFVIGVLFSVVALAAVVLMLRGSGRKGGNLDELRARLRPLDVNAFRNLIDESEEHFLRDRLPAAEFRSIHRERMLAATEYLWSAARNADILMQLGEAARHDAESSVAEAGAKLQANAFRVRMNALQSLPRYYLRALIPGLGGGANGLAESCDRLTRQAVILGCLGSDDRGISGVFS
jgi:hypothetical protein